MKTKGIKIEIVDGRFFTVNSKNEPKIFDDLTVCLDYCSEFLSGSDVENVTE